MIHYELFENAESGADLSWGESRNIGMGGEKEGRWGKRVQICDDRKKYKYGR